MHEVGLHADLAQHHCFLVVFAFHVTRSLLSP
jgi:hypothetical protein